jgi:hypothetical protein
MAALRGMRPGVRYGLLMLMVAGGAMNMLREHAESIRGGGRLADLNSPEMRSMREDVRRHPERTYLVANDDPLIAQWLCYFARGSKVYVDRWHLGDRMVASEQFNFRRLPDRATELWWLDPQRRGRVADFWPAAALHIRGAVEEGQVASGRYYVVSDDLHVDIDRATSGSLEQQLWLDLVAVPLPEMTPLEFELIGPDQRRQPTTLLGPTRVRFHLVLSAGTNAFILRAGPAAAGAVGGRVIVQALSLNPLTQRSPASDPVPVSFASTVEARAGR